MRKLFILTAVLALTASAGCGCCDWCKRPCGQPPCAYPSSCPCQTGPVMTPGTQVVPGPDAYATPPAGG